MPLLLAAQLLLLTLPTTSDARNAYVANKNSGTVSIFDTTSNAAMEQTIRVGSRPIATAITPDGTRLYVTNAINVVGSVPGTVSVIDTSTNEVVDDPIPVGKNPVGITVAPDGTSVYVTNYGSNTVSVIDTDENRVEETIDLPVGSAPHGIAITPDGSHVYVANENSHTVTMIDTDNDLVTTFGGPSQFPWPMDIAIAPDGTSVYVTNYMTSIVSVIDTDENTVHAVDNVGISPSGIAITPDGTRAYIANWWMFHYVLTLSTADNTVSPRIGEGHFNTPIRIAISPDGETVYVVNYGASTDPSTISVINTNDNRVLEPAIPVEKLPDGIAITPNQGPTADFTVTPGEVDEETTFDASNSSDSDGEVVRYDWDFGDGETLDDAGPAPTHIYGDAGTYTATLTVTDNEGGSTEFVSDGRTAYHNGSGAAIRSVTFDVIDDGVEPGPKPEPAPTPSSGPFIAGQPEGCKKVLYENRLEVPREVRLADLVTGKGVKVKASASQEGPGTLKVEITGRKARYFKVFGELSRVKDKTLVSKKVRVGTKSTYIHLKANGKARRLIQRALRLMRAPNTTKLKVSLTSHATANKSLKRLNTQTVRALRRGKVKRTATYIKVRQVVDDSRCGNPLKAKITGPKDTKLTALTTKKGKKGKGTKVRVSCSVDCTATVGYRLWGRYEVGLKFRKPGQKINRLLATQKVKLGGGETRTLILDGATSKNLRRLLVRGSNKKRYKRIKIKYVIEARTSDGRRDVAARTSRVRLSFK